MVRNDEPQARLHIADIGPNEGEYSLIGGADFSVALTGTNVRICDALALVLHREGYTRATLVLSAGESANRAAKAIKAPVEAA